MTAPQDPDRRDILKGIAAASCATMSCAGWPAAAQPASPGVSHRRTCLGSEADVVAVLSALRRCPDCISASALRTADGSFVIWQDWGAPEAAGMFWSGRAALRIQTLTRMEI
ncbi:hypothetical protein [Dinoroseobacter sp. S124A]|uniref:hypothetical protein n=1 Tax=Dinoroseobacter sp. S124A TaxID=3415128 RepID=UPI003C7D0126